MGQMQEEFSVVVQIEKLEPPRTRSYTKEGPKLRHYRILEEGEVPLEFLRGWKSEQEGAAVA